MRGAGKSLGDLGVHAKQGLAAILDECAQTHEIESVFRFFARPKKVIP